MRAPPAPPGLAAVVGGRRGGGVSARGTAKEPGKLCAQITTAFAEQGIQIIECAIRYTWCPSTCDQCRVRSTKMEEMLDKRKMKLDPKVRFVRLVNLPTRQA